MAVAVECEICRMPVWLDMYGAHMESHDEEEE